MHTRFYLGMSAANDHKPEFENKYHGWSQHSDTPFTRGTFFIERNANDKVAAHATMLRYNKDIARQVGLNGGFLESNLEGNTWCLSTLKDDNYVGADGKASTRIQHNRCPTLEDFEKRGAAFIERFLWTGDAAMFATDRIILRQICSENVMKRVRPTESLSEPVLVSDDGSVSN